MGIVRKIKDAARWVENVVEVDAPRPAPETEEKAPPPKPKPATGSLQRLGEYIGIVAVTVLAAGVGLAGCDRPSGTSPSSPNASCDEPATWCGGSAVTR